MAGSDEAGSQSHTQVEFGTQLPRDDNPRIIGVNRLEPVLAGNTQREEIRPVPPKNSKPAFNDPKKLLGLLHPNHAPRAIVDRPPKPTHASGSQLMTQLPVNVNRQPTQTQSIGRAKDSTSPEQSRRTRRAREVEAALSPVRKRTQHRSSGDATAPKREANQLQRLASECSWMQDLEFTRETFRVSSDQLNILRKNDSWHKPRPGCKFPNGNIPVNILTMLYRRADENADLDAAPDSDDEMDEDPSPELPVASTNASAESAPQTTQDDQLPTSPVSQVSWSASPTPEPPRLPTRSNQQLPPDSSFEPVEPVEPAEDDAARKSVVSSQMRDHILIESSNEDELDDPPSSPPVAEDAAETDEDMEMEEHVPQALGEDSVDRANDRPQRSLSTTSPPPRPVVQVKETPYVRNNNGQLRTQADPAPSRRLSSSGTSKHNSIVHGTYDDKPSLDPQASATQTSVIITNLEKSFQSDGLQDKQQENETGHEVSRQVLDNAPLEMIGHKPAMLEAMGASRELQPALEVEAPKRSIAQDAITIEVPEPTPVSAQMPPSNSERTTEPSLPPAIEGRLACEDGNRAMLSKSPSHASGAAKRKYNTSPSRRNSRHSKRREIKIVGFGDDPPDSTDPALTIRHYREESLRRYREARKSSLSAENRPEAAAKAEAPHEGDTMQIDTPAISRIAALASPLSPQHDPVERVQPVSAPGASTSQASHIAMSAREIASSVFERFKAAYPEYTGDTKHFQGQCTQIIQLDQEDKMVPKWQWDDYIIRNRTDYKDYAVERIKQGKDPEPYHRFYKDMIRDTIYRKAVIEGPNTLVEALQQLESPLPERQHGDSPRKPSRKEKRARASLPSAFHHPKLFSKSHQAISAPERPRKSLPPRTQHSPHTPLKDSHVRRAHLPPPAVPSGSRSNERSTPTPHSLSRLSLDGAASPGATPGADTTAGASDPFRDFVFAYTRTTSFTGSTKVSPEPHRNIGRKS